MEQERFDALAKQVFAGTSRRRVVGGAIASVVGAGFAAVTGVSAKNDKKGKGKAKKGDSLYVEGRLQYRSYQDEEGSTRGSCEIVAENVQFLSRRGPAPEA